MNEKEEEEGGEQVDERRKDSLHDVMSCYFDVQCCRCSLEVLMKRWDLYHMKCEEVLSLWFEKLVCFYNVGDGLSGRAEVGITVVEWSILLWCLNDKSRSR